jgi:hypothetical protein
MAENAWNTKIEVTSGGVPAGRQNFELTNITKKTKVVNYIGAFKGIRGLVNKEYAELDANQQKIVDDAPKEFWEPRNDKEKANPREKQRFGDQIVLTLTYTDPEKGTKHDLDARFPTPGPALGNFITKATGITVGPSDDIKFADVFKPGDKFVAEVEKNDAGFSNLKIPTIMKAELAAPIVTGTAALGPKETELLEYLKKNYTGKRLGDITNIYQAGDQAVSADPNAAKYDPANGRFGSYPEASALWRNIVGANVKYTTDKKTFNFEQVA